MPPEPAARIPSEESGRQTALRRLAAASLLQASLFIAGFALAPTVVSAELFAGRLTEENLERYRPGGPDADAGIGDWALSNGTLCAVVSDPQHESALSPAGGVLIDLGHCGARDDQWTVLQPMLNLSQRHIVPVSGIEAGDARESAWLRTRAQTSGVELVIRYTLRADRPRALDVSLRARRLTDGDRLFSVGLTVLHPSAQTPVYSLLTRAPERSPGFVHPASDRSSILSLLNALGAADLSVLLGGDAMPPISYGIERRSSRLREGDETSALGAFSITGGHFTLFNAMTRPLWIGEPHEAPGPLQLAQLPFMDLEGEAVLESDFRIHVGRRGDVASITDRLYVDAPLVSGRVDDPTARIHVDHASGAPFTEIRPEADGRFAVRLPAGSYRAHVRAAGERETTLDFTVDEARPSQTLPPISLAPPARVRLPRDFVGRLTFLAEDGSGPAVFGSNLLGLRIGPKPLPSHTEAPFLNLAASPLDPESIVLAAGRYRVIAVRGPEYGSHEATIEARPGEELVLELDPLPRIAETPGWIAADFHVHSGESFDSSLPQPLQAIAFAASGAELLVATEHDRVFDPAPAIARAGLDGKLRSMTGAEITSSFAGGDTPYSSGHLNAFPLVPRPAAYRGGAPFFEGRRLRDALAALRAPESSPFVQLNHPRPKPQGGEGDTFFSHLGVVGEPFDPTLPLDQPPNTALAERSPVHGGRDLDFEGIELMNGRDPVYYRRVRADWLSLLLQGERLVATANSDSHRLGVIVGLPRTYVAQVDDDLAAFDESALMAALRAGRAWGTTGPLLRVELDETGLGGLHAGATGTLRIEVDAAPWVPISEWRAYVNGERVHRAAIAAGERAALPLVFPTDAFVTVEVEGPAEGRYAEVLPGFVPLAFSNPIFVDADGNGRFDAPGLPSPLPATITDPDRPDRAPLHLEARASRGPAEP